MTAETVAFLNLGIHSLTLAAFGWCLVRFFIRDARRRSVAAGIAIIFSLCGPVTISSWPYPYQSREVPVLGAIHQVLEADWRIVIQPQAAPENVAEPATQHSAKFVWDVNQAVGWMSCTFWTVMAGMMLRHLWRTWQVWLWRRRLRAPAPTEMEAIPEVLRSQRIGVFDHEGTPCVAGCWRPVIAVPASAFQMLTSRQWHWLMRHEGEHLRGADTMSAWVYESVRAFLWWNPFVHALIECHARAREEVCDAAALRQSEKHQDYAEFLLTWASASCSRTVVPGVMPMAQSRPARRLKARLMALMEARQVSRRLGPLFVMACAGAAVGIPILTASIGITTRTMSAEPVAVTAAEGTEEKMFTRVYQVRPDFLSRETAENEQLTAKVFLERKGVSFPHPASAVFISGSSKLIAKNTRENLSLVEQIIDASYRSTPHIRFACMFIQADHFLGESEKVVSGTTAKDLMNSARQRKGANLISSPTLVTLLDQRGTIEIIRSNPANPGQFVGLRQDLLGRRDKNGRVVVEMKSELSMEVGNRLIPVRDAPVDWSQVKLYASQGRTSLASGETFVHHLQAGGDCITVLITATAVKPDGKPATGFDEIIETGPPKQKEDGAMLPAKAFEREVQRAEEVQEALSRKKVALSVILADVPDSTDVLGELDPKNFRLSIGNDFLPDEGSRPALEGQFMLGGVLSKAQLQTLERSMKEHKDVRLALLPKQAVPDGGEALFDLPEKAGGRQIKITAVLGADGRTIDLMVTPPSAGGDARKPNTVSVSIWPDQTLVFGSLAAGEKLSRVILVTAGMEELK